MSEQSGAVRKRLKKEAPMSAQSIIALGFLAIILIVAALLMLPVSSASGTMTVTMKMSL